MKRSPFSTVAFEAVSTFRYRALSAACVALAADLHLGCGATKDEPPNPNVDVWHSGTRLRARILDAGNGVAQFVAWHDQKTGEECYFAPAEDGEMRCVPSGFVDSMYYEDAACEEPVVVPQAVSCGDTQREWFQTSIAESNAAGCATAARSRVLHATGPSTSQFLYYGGPGDCRPNAQAVAGALRVDVVAPDQMVAAREVIGPVFGSLAPLILEADDGAKQVTSVVDATTHRVCYRQESRSGELRCIPSEHIAWQNGRHFADSACAEKVAYASCDTPDIIFSDDLNDCNDGRVYALGDQIAGPSYENYSGACAALTSGGYVLYRLGAEIFDQFPLVEDMTSGTGTVRSRRWGVAGVALSSDAALFDEKTGSDCRVIRNDDVRCAPDYARAAQATGAFSDSSCTTPLLVQNDLRLTQCNESPPPLPAPIIGMNGSNSCGDPVYVTLGAAWTDTVYQRNDTGLCQPATPSYGPNARFYVPGDPVDPTTFPLIVDRVE